MNPSCAGGNHAAIWVERQVLGWVREMLGFPPESMGLLVSGGSMASLTALAVARHVGAGWDVRRHGLQGARPKLTMYLSEEGHGCMRNAAELLGMGSENLPDRDRRRPAYARRCATPSAWCLPTCGDVDRVIEIVESEGRALAADVAGDQASCSPTSKAP